MGKYSLWFIPVGEIYTKLAILIKDLSKKYSGPVFEPHITLLPDIVLSEEEIVEKTSKLVSNKNPFSVEVDNIDYQDAYFKNLFIKVKLNDDLVNLYNEAKQIFRLDNDKPYMPHISILYGNHSKKTKEEIIKKISLKFNQKFLVKSIVISTSGEVSEWKKVKEFKF